MKILKHWYRAEATEGGDLGGTATPTADTTPEADTGVADVNDTWGDMVSDEQTSTDVNTHADITDTPPVATPPVAPVAPTVPPVAAEPTAVQPPTPQAQPVANAETPAAPVDLVALRQNYQNELTNYYALSQEDAQRFQTEPELVLPSLAAKVHLEVLDAVMAQLPQRVTQMISHHAEVTKREKQAEDEFFAPFPDLAKHKDAVLRVGQMYRAANPTATKEQAIKAIGDFVRQSLGLTAPAPVVQSAPAPTNPFIPAGSSGSGAVPPQRSEWDFLIEDE
jgi:hypothetical protein